VWIVDPLDGTVNYYNGIPHFCSCVACYYLSNGDNPSKITPKNDLSAMGEPLVGVVYAPIADELFVGVNGQGATRNDKPIQVRPQQKLCETVVGISFGSNEETMRHMERITSTLIRCCHKVRILGSCGLDIASIACGRLGALVQQSVHCWDFAASRIILEEAGGVFDAVERELNTWNIVACIPDALEHLKKVTRRVV
jgi:fructose-1,6-bisphosphatase/inositol monophosphatase family enzyme